MSIINITSNNPYVQVHQTQSSYVGNNGSGAGMVRYNTSGQQLEAFDGCSWLPISQHISIDMNYGTIDAIQWAIKKMTEEKRVQELAEQHPMVQDAVNTLKTATDQLQVALALTEKFD